MIVQIEKLIVNKDMKILSKLILRKKGKYLPRHRNNIDSI